VVKVLVKCTDGKTMKMGPKSRRNERGYDLEKLWIGTNERKDTRTIQYPDNLTVSRENIGELTRFYIARQCCGQVVVDLKLMGNQGCDLRIKLPVSTRLYTPTHQGM
jgi:hypothetical protein